MEVKQEPIDVIKSALSHFGLNDAEILVFSASMSLGTRPASKIAKHAGINRAHAYDILSSLAIKGLMKEIIKNN